MCVCVCPMIINGFGICYMLNVYVYCIVFSARQLEILMIPFGIFMYVDNKIFLVSLGLSVSPQ